VSLLVNLLGELLKQEVADKTPTDRKLQPSFCLLQALKGKEIRGHRFVSGVWGYKSLFEVSFARIQIINY
jgi:hypothetical protein